MSIPRQKLPARQRWFFRNLRSLFRLLLHCRALHSLAPGHVRFLVPSYRHHFSFHAEGIGSTYAGTATKNSFQDRGGSFPMSQRSMRRIVILLANVVSLGCVAVGQTGDLGAQIAAADAKLGASPGQIIVSTSGTISEGEVSLSVGHSLVCTGHTTISLNAGSYLYQNSHTSIKNCIISSTATPIQGEIQSSDTNDLELDNVTFVGGGNLVYWVGVSDFVISDNQITSITAADPATDMVQNGYYLMNCSRGKVNNLVVTGFVFPPGRLSVPAIVGLFNSSEITINNVSINNVDASFAFGGSGIQINGSSHITINGGMITNDAKMDGVTCQSSGTTFSSDITITGLNASYDGHQGLNTTAPLTLGDGIDMINSRRVRISNCTILGSGYSGNGQPGIWLFLDDEVEVSNCTLSDGSTAGIALAGSPNVRLINNTIRQNKESGTFTEAQIGTGTSAGSTVTWVSGLSGGFSLAWEAGTPFMFDGITYKVASVPDDIHIVLTPSPPPHPSPVAWEVDSINEEILGGLIEDNGLGLTGGQTQVGIDWANSTNGIISGVTSTNTGIGDQLYGLELDNLATAILNNDNFAGNLNGGIDAGLQYVAPSTLSFPDQGVATTSPAQTVTLKAGQIVVQNLLVQVTGDFSETNNCGTQVLAYRICQIQTSFTPTGGGVATGTLTITADAPNNPQTVLLTGTGVSHGLGLSIATGASSSVTVVAGTTAQYLLSIGGAGMSGAVTLSCSGAPKGASCSLPATETLSASQATPFTVSVTTLAHATAALRPTPFRLSPWLGALAMMGCVVFSRVRPKRPGRRQWLWLPPLLLVFLCSCGGSGNTASSGTPAGDYSLTITATVGSTSQQLKVVLTVQ